MRTSFTFVTLSLLASAMAMPGNYVPRQVMTRQTDLCSSGTPQCCDVDVLGIADLDCETAPSVPTNITDFNAICASVGKIDMCCLLPILEQGLICTSPDGS